MPTARKTLIGAAVLAAVFFAGYLPQVSAARALRQQAEACQARLRFASLVNSIGLVYLEANQKNYGIASQHATRFFEGARQALSDSPAAAQRSTLQDALSKRDAITAGLAKGDAGVLADIQAVFGAVLRSPPE